MSADGNTIAAGSISEDSVARGLHGPQQDDAALSAGAVYVFTRSGSAWGQQAYVKSANNDADDLFGYGVALSANGRQEDDSAADSGAAYLFVRSGATWRQHAYIKASNTEAFGEFGVSVAMSGSGLTFIVGARTEAGPNNATPEAGAA